MSDRDRSSETIRADEAYTTAEFRRRTLIGDFAFRKLRREGFPIVAIGRKQYVRGADWLAYLERVANK